MVLGYIVGYDLSEMSNYESASKRGAKKIGEITNVFSNG